MIRVAFSTDSSPSPSRLLTSANRAGPEEFGIAQSGQFFPQGRIGSNQDGLELIDGLRARFDGRHLRNFVHSRDLHRPVARFARPRARPLNTARAAF
ncbi:hypothetical protein ACFVU4_25375 [Streptomyces sp. NPDC058107]|uniref:hypothetical protein n=1 Tax=Streptomyces sp. NPDC058107 TaxID=3346343 RepID=UPI0036F0FA7E